MSKLKAFAHTIQIGDSLSGIHVTVVSRGRAVADDAAGPDANESGVVGDLVGDAVDNGSPSSAMP